MGDFLSTCMNRAEREADKVANAATRKVGDEAKTKVVDGIDDLIHKTTHKVDDKTSTELLDSHWCVLKESDGVSFTKVEQCEGGSHRLKDCDAMVLKCSDGKDLEITKQCSKCQKHIMGRS